MTKFAFLLILPAALVCALNVDPAQAQRARVFVSVSGDDANPCTAGSPCKTFQHAHDVVQAGGVIDVLDIGGYGTLNITKAISIEGHGYAAVVASNGADGITVNAGASDDVNLRGLVLEGLGGTGGDGISFFTGASLSVEDCLIRDYSINGINFRASGSSKLSVLNTLVSDNLDIGIVVLPSGFGNVVVADLSHVQLDNNLKGGLIVVGNFSTGTLSVTVGDSVVTKNGNSGGISVQSQAGAAPTSVLVRNSMIANNPANGLSSSGNPATVRVTRTTITGNSTGLAGTIISYGDNNVDGNTTDGAPTSTISAK
jgi:hypothetical protein